MTVGLASQLSVALALPVPVWSGAVDAPHWSVALAGHVITGLVVSTNRRCWTQVAWLPQASVAFQVRSMSRPVQPPAGLSVWLMVGLPGQLSVAVAEPVINGLAESPHCSVLSGGHVITGLVVSTNVMCW